MPVEVLYEEKKFYQSARFWRWVIAILYILLCLLAFQDELRSMWDFSMEVLRGHEKLLAVLQRQDFRILVANFLSFFFFFYMGLMITSQFVLPVQTWEERRKVYERLRRYLRRKHGPAVFIKEAQIIGQAAELESSFPGVVFVDLSSAIALENQSVMMSPEKAPEPGRIGSSTTNKRKSKRRKPLPTRTRPVRVAGPGIVFTGSGEMLRGVADLRRQFRIAPNASFATRDGFSVLSHVFVIFSLGENPEVLKVTCLGDKPEDIRTVKVDERTKKVTGFKDELDVADKSEIFQFVNSYRPETVEDVWQDDSSPPPVNAPYVYDPERIFAAIYSEQRNTADNTSDRWTDLPPRVAIEVFRDMLSLKKFNDLYLPNEPFDDKQAAETFPFLEDFRPEFSQRVRNLGVLAFQYGKRRDGKILDVGDRWDEDAIEILPERKLRNSKVLRNRGIRVIAAGFPELNPAHPGVRGQLVEYWSAGWKRETEQTEAEHQLEAMRMQTKARADAQRDMVALLQRIYSLEPLSQEAMAVRLFQALEQVAAEPRTRQLLPEDSLSFLWDLRQYLLPAPGGED